MGFARKIKQEDLPSLSGGGNQVSVLVSVAALIFGVFFHSGFANADVGSPGGMPAMRPSETKNNSHTENSPPASPKVDEANPFPIIASVRLLRPQLSYNIDLAGATDNSDPENVGDRKFKGIQYSAQSLNAVGVSASWNGYGASFSKEVGSLDGKVTKRYVDYAFDGAFDSWGFDAFYQHSEGAVQILTEKERRLSSLGSNSESNSSSETSGGSSTSGSESPPSTWVYDVETRTAAPDTIMVHQGFNLYGAIFRKNFSFANAFELNDLFVKNGIAIPWVASYTFEEFDGTTVIIPEDYAHLFELSREIVDVHSTTYSLGSGFAGSATMKKFFLSGMMLVGLGYASTQYKTTAESENIPRVTLKSSLRLNVGLNFRRFYTAAQLFLDGNQQSIEELTITSQNTQMSLTAAMRL